MRAGVSCLGRLGACTAPTFDDAVEVHKIIDAIEKSAESGMRVKVAQ